MGINPRTKNETRAMRLRDGQEKAGYASFLKVSELMSWIQAASWDVLDDTRELTNFGRMRVVLLGAQCRLNSTTSMSFFSRMLLQKSSSVAMSLARGSG